MSELDKPIHLEIVGDRAGPMRKVIDDLRMENAALLAANRDLKLHWDVLKADYDRLLALIPECRRAARQAWGSHGDVFITMALEGGDEQA